MPGRISEVFGGEMTVPRLTMNTLEADASVSFPSRKRMVSDAPASAEICRALGVTESHLWVLLFRARMGLKRVLDRDFFAPA